MDMEQRTKIMLAWELHEQGLSNSQITRRLEINRETTNRWIAAIGEQGLIPFLEQYRCHARQPRPRPHLGYRNMGKRPLDTVCQFMSGSEQKTEQPTEQQTARQEG